jgi:Pyridoxal phosphate biosynthetic protein PdxA/UreF
MFLMLVAAALRIVHVTLHESVQSAPNRTSIDLIAVAAETAVSALQRLGLANPSIGVFGINPHAGENGFFACDRESLVDWLSADLCHGSGRNEAIFFGEPYRCTAENDLTKLILVAELAAAHRGTSELAMESSQQSSACLSMLRHVWPDRILKVLSEFQRQPVLAVILGARTAKEESPPAWLCQISCKAMSPIWSTQVFA